MILLATQLSNSWVQLKWMSDDPDPVGGFDISMAVFPNAPVIVSTVFGFEREWIQTTSPWIAGDVVAYDIVDNDTLTTASASLTIANLDAPFTFGPVDPLHTTSRYTTVDSVKDRLGIPLTDTSRDDDVLQAIIAGEYALDVFLGRSFPDTGDNPKVNGIPQAVRNASLSIAIAAWKEADAPTGSMGSDEFFGSIDVTEVARQILQRSPMLAGFKVSWGTG